MKWKEILKLDEGGYSSYNEERSFGTETHTMPDGTEMPEEYEEEEEDDEYDYEEDQKQRIRNEYWNSNQWSYDWGNWLGSLDWIKFFDKYVLERKERYDKTAKKLQQEGKPKQRRAWEYWEKRLKDRYNRATRGIAEQYNWWKEYKPQYRMEGLDSYEHLMNESKNEYKEYLSKKREMDVWVNQNLN